MTKHTANSGATRRAAHAPAPSAPIPDAMPLLDWRSFPLLNLRQAAQIAGCSAAKLYALAAAGVLEFRRPATNRTMVTTASVLKMLDASEIWTPDTSRVSAARGRNREIAAERAGA